MAQILAVIIFLAMFILIITEIWERHIVTLGCALLTLVLVFGLCMHSPSAIIETLVEDMDGSARETTFTFPPRSFS